MSFMKQTIGRLFGLSKDNLSLEIEAKKRMVLSHSAPTKVSELTKGESREKASKMFNVGTTYISQAKKLKNRLHLDNLSLE